MDTQKQKRNKKKKNENYKMKIKKQKKGVNSPGQVFSAAKLLPIKMVLWGVRGALTTPPYLKSQATNSDTAKAPKELIKHLSLQLR